MLNQSGFLTVVVHAGCNKSYVQLDCSIGVYCWEVIDSVLPVFLTPVHRHYDTLATGIVYFHRFYMFHSFKQFPRYVSICWYVFFPCRPLEVKLNEFAMSTANYALVITKSSSPGTLFFSFPPRGERHQPFIWILSYFLDASSIKFIIKMLQSSDLWRHSVF